MEKNQTEVCKIELCCEVVERRLAERRLQERERRYSDIFHNISDSICLLEVTEDGRFRYLETNRAFEVNAGVPVDGLLGKYAGDLLRSSGAEASVENAIASLRRCLEVGSVVEEEVTLDLTCGWRVYYTTLTPLFDDSGRIDRILGISRDITKQKRMEQTIVAREQEFRSLAESSPISIIRYCRDGRIRYLNAGLLGYLGVSAADIIGKLPSEVWPDGRYAQIERASAQAVATGEATIVEFCEADPAGVLYFGQIHVVPERDAVGQIIGTIAFGLDVTAIRMAERQLSHFVESLPGMAYNFRLSPEGHASFPYASSAIEAFYGLKPEDVKNDIAQLHMLVHPDDLSRIEAAIAESARTMTLFHIEYRVCRPGQSVRWLEARSLPEREADGGIIWYGFVLDITERKQAEIALKSSQRMLSEAQAIAKLGSWDWDVVRNRVEWSDMAYDIYTPDERPAAPGYEEFKQSVHPDDLERVDAAVRSAFEHDTPFDIEHRVVSQSKGVRTVHAHARVFRDHNGNPIRMVGTVHDITEQKRIEDTLKFIAQRGWQADGELFLTGLASYMGRMLEVDYVIIDKLGGGSAKAETVAIYAKGEVLPNMQYSLQGTPCNNVMDTDLCCYPDKVQQRFPEDFLLVDMGVESYVGIPLWDSSGTAIGLIAVMDGKPMQDTTAVTSLLKLVATRAAAELERERYDHLLLERERAFRTLAESIPDNLMRFDRQCRLQYINPAMRRSLAPEFQLTLGKSHTEAFPGVASAIQYQRRLERLMETGEGGELETQFPNAQGEMRTQHVIYVAERDEHGKIVGALSIGRDITESKRAEEVLRASEQKFRSLAENMPDVLIRYDRECRRTYVNPVFERMFASTDQQIIGLTPQQANPINLPEAYQQALKYTLATGERSELEIQVSTVSGGASVGFISIAAERSADAQISGAIVIGRDITKLKQAEQQLRELTAHIQTVREEEKAHLAREIHDDLGSTLAALKLRLSHLLEFEFSEDMKKAPLFTRLEWMSQILESAIASTRRIITDMRPDVLDNLGLFAALKWQAEQFQKHSGIGCRVVCANDHRCVTCKDCEFPQDKTLSINLFRIFQEALSNVARHSGASSVEAEYRPGNHVVVLSISDNGRGLPEEHAPASTSFGIRGMRERIGQLGGQIKFDSPPGGGLRVTVQLPLATDNNGMATF